MLIIPLSLHLCWMLTMDLMLVPHRGSALQLDMAEDSVDDMYDGCSDAMKDILDKSFSKERDHVGWKTSKPCLTEKLNIRSSEDSALTADHLQAICMYTGYVGYGVINKEVKTKREEYGGAFQFHTLHFYLTSAIQILNKNNNNQCHNTYRRTRDKTEGEINQKMRFGFFTSTSFESDLSQFGTETCFKIKTCLGAYLKNYPKRGTDEEEVLIPPYEMFIIKQVVKKAQKPLVEGLEDCNVVYVLEHHGGKSNLNCKLYKKYQDSQHAHG